MSSCPDDYSRHTTPKRETCQPGLCSPQLEEDGPGRARLANSPPEQDCLLGARGAALAFVVQLDGDEQHHCGHQGQDAVFGAPGPKDDAVDLGAEEPGRVDQKRHRDRGRQGIVDDEYVGPNVKHARGKEDPEAQTRQETRDEDDLAAVGAEVGAHTTLAACADVAVSEGAGQDPVSYTH